MPGPERPREVPLRPAGPRVNLLSVLSLAALAFFVLVVLTLVASDLVYLFCYGTASLDEIGRLLVSARLRTAVRLSITTSTVTLALILVTAVPVGYALSRYRFRGHALVNTVVDVPIVLPPVVIGLSLLAFFRTPLGELIRAGLKSGNWSTSSMLGIVLCQYLVSVSYAIRAMKASFDSADRGLEQVALSLGCSSWRAFRKVTLPLARNGLIAGAIMAWARAVGVFGALAIFVGTASDVLVMPTAIYLEIQTGDIEMALVIALLSVLLAGTALAVVHCLVPGRKWT
ncbi:MAG TPA: ABC transporter permease [Planctomycetota bacterium]|nr:ABC transporter permease [Planctomycetota bacterium]